MFTRLSCFIKDDDERTISVFELITVLIFISMTISLLQFYVTITITSNNYSNSKLLRKSFNITYLCKTAVLLHYQRKKLII